MTLRLIHSADVHGTSALYEALSEFSQQPDTLLLDAGDAISGSNTAFRWDEPNLTRMSELGFSAMTMGNRELHYLPAVLELRNRQRNFPLLAANLVDLWGREKTWQDGVSLRVGELKVGVFGMTVVQYPVGSLYEKILGLRFLPPESLMEPLCRQYEDHDVVIFLSHLGVTLDRELARIVQAGGFKLDLILGGHTHVTFREPEKFGQTLLSHIGSHSAGFGDWKRTDDGQWSHRFVPLPKAAGKL